MDLEAAMAVVYSGPSLMPVFASTFGDIFTGGGTAQSPTGDLDGDGFVGENDLMQLLSDIGSGDESNPANDLNDDGSVDKSDLAILIGHFGEGPSNQGSYGFDSCSQWAGLVGVTYAFAIVFCGFGSYFSLGALLAPCFAFLTGSQGLFLASLSIVGGCTTCIGQSFFFNDPNFDCGI